MGAARLGNGAPGGSGYRCCCDATCSGLGRVRRSSPATDGGRLFGVGFRAAGEGGDDCGGDDHCYESKADKKIMHWSGSLVGFV